MTRPLAQLFSFVLALALFGSAARAEDPSFEAFGQAPISQGDRARAHDRALDDALRQAVTQAAALIAGDAAAQSSDLRLRILPRAKGYIVNYRILDESDQPNGMLQVHVSAQVSNARLVADLQHAAVVQAAKTVLVCAPDAAVGSLLTQALGGRQLNVRSLPGCATGSLVEQLRSTTVGWDGALGAEIALTPGGQVRGTDQVAAHADVVIRLYEAGGRVSAEGRGQADAYAAQAAVAESNARAGAAEHALTSLRKAVDAKWPLGGRSGLTVLVRTSRYTDYAAVTHALGQVAGVTAVEPRRFGSDGVELWATTALPSAQLAEALGRAPGSSGWTAESDGVRVRVRVPDPATSP